MEAAAVEAVDDGNADEPAEGPAEAGVAAEAPAEQEGAARQAGGGGEVGRNRPTVPRRGPKRGEPDLEEKFGRFEIKPPPSRRVGPSSGGAANPLLSEQGDETVSMVSDTWSTDVLASDTETLPGEAESVGGRSVGLDDIVRGGNRMLDELVVPPTGGGVLGQIVVVSHQNF